MAQLERNLARGLGRHQIMTTADVLRPALFDTAVVKDDVDHPFILDRMFDFRPSHHFKFDNWFPHRLAGQGRSGECEQERLNFHSVDNISVLCSEQTSDSR